MNTEMVLGIMGVALIILGALALGTSYNMMKLADNYNEIVQKYLSCRTNNPQVEPLFNLTVNWNETTGLR